LTGQGIAELATQLSSISGLSEDERGVILSAATSVLNTHLHAKVARTLLVELNNARMRGDLKGDTPYDRWMDCLSRLAGQEFWAGLEAPYPTLRPRTKRLVTNALAAALSFADRWAADRHLTNSLCGGRTGELRSVTFAAGDTHCGGQTMAILTLDSGKL